MLRQIQSYCWHGLTIIQAGGMFSLLVSEILNSLKPLNWTHVATKLNPADCAPRGLSPLVLVMCYDLTVLIFCAKTLILIRLGCGPLSLGQSLLMVAPWEHVTPNILKMIQNLFTRKASGAQRNPDLHAYLPYMKHLTRRYIDSCSTYPNSLVTQTADCRLTNSTF